MFCDFLATQLCHAIFPTLAVSLQSLASPSPQFLSVRAVFYYYLFSYFLDFFFHCPIHKSNSLTAVETSNALSVNTAPPIKTNMNSVPQGVNRLTRNALWTIQNGDNRGGRSAKRFSNMSYKQRDQLLSATSKGTKHYLG